MTTKTKKLPDGMAELLDRVGRDTQTSGLCTAGDYPAALEHVRRIMGAPHDWKDPDRVRRQDDTNAPRADAYTLLVAMLEGLVDGDA